MRTYLLLIITIALTASDSDAPSAGVPHPNNAALHYWAAFAYLPSGTDSGTTPFQQYHSGTQPTDTSPWNANLVTTMLRASEVDACFWGTDLERDGASALMPFLPPARTTGHYLAYLIHLHPDRTDQLLIAGLSLSRHLQGSDTLIEFIVGHAIELSLWQELTRIIPQLPPHQRSELAGFIEQLEPHPSPATAMLGERHFATWLRRTLSNEGAAGVMTLLMTHGAENDLLLQGLAGLTVTEQTERLNHWIDELDADYLKLAQLMNLHGRERIERLAAFEQEWQENANPLESLLIPAIDSVIEIADQNAATVTIIHTLLTTPPSLSPAQAVSQLDLVDTAVAEPLPNGTRLRVSLRESSATVVLDIAPKFSQTVTPDEQVRTPSRPAPTHGF